MAEIIKKRLKDIKGDQIAARAKEARMNLERGASREGTLKDLMEDLDRDERHLK